MSTRTPTPEPSGATRATPPPARSRSPLLMLLGLFVAVIVAGLLYLVFHDDGRANEPSGRSVAQTGALPPSPAPSATGGGAGAAAGTGSAPSASTPPSSLRRPADVVGWVGGAGQKPDHATGGLAKEGSVGTVLFPTGSATLDADAKQVIVAVAGELKKQKPSSVRVTGYTDTVGTPGYNLGLSERRAKAVSDVLEAELPPGWVVSTGKGWADPVAANTSDENRQMNRRTTITTA